MTADRHPSAFAAIVRGATVVLGLWLFVSAFLWHHTPWQLMATWMTGAFVAILAAMALLVPPLRYFNTAAALWLCASALAMPHAVGTAWNNCAVALAVFVLSLFPNAFDERELYRDPIPRI